MKKKNIGRIKNVKYNSDTKDMEITLVINDNKFKKRLLRDLSLSGELEIEGENVFYTGNIRGNS